jgi:O-acetylhomoserine (thiol)-lyase
VVESGKFDWANGRYPHMVEPSVGYHGVRFAETFGDFAFTMKARMETLRTLGPCLAPMSAWMLLQGIETLPVRMDRHVRNAMAVADFLQSHQKVAWVNYPGLKSNPFNTLAQRYMPKGAGGILSFGIKAPQGKGSEAGEKFIQACTFLSHLANVGDAKSLVIHPASTTHRQMSESEQAKAGVSADLIRLSVGLESIDDLLWDIDQALKVATN